MLSDAVAEIFGIDVHDPILDGIRHFEDEVDRDNDENTGEPDDQDPVPPPPSHPRA